MTSKRAEVRDFLVTRRAKITPDRAGLTIYGTNRRVPGLRREEVALLAGLSVDYYTRLEKGNLSGASDTVLHAIADALQLDEAERVHLFDLARAANAGTRTARPAAARRTQPIRPSLQRILDGMTGVPAFVRNGRLDLLGATRLGRALYSPVYDSPTNVDDRTPPNLARFRFLDPAAVDFYPDWPLSANNTVALLRIEAGRDPYDKGLTDLVGELCTRSEEFRTRWAAHDVKLHRSGTKVYHHPIVGDLSLDFEALEISADTGLTLTAYSAEPGTSSADALALLASWTSSNITADVPTEV